MRKRCGKYRGGRWLDAGLFSGVPFRTSAKAIRAFSEPMPCETLYTPTTEVQLANWMAVPYLLIAAAGSYSTSISLH
jgi:hypothetical protein